MAKTIPLKKRKIVSLPLDTLTIHPALEDAPRLAAKDPRFLAMCQAWTDQQSCPPIYCTEDGKIVDGRHRYWWLSQVGATEADAVIVSEDEVYSTILSALAGRNHLTKGQRAFLAMPVLDGAWKEAQQRQVEIIQKGGAASATVAATTEQLAEQLGVSRSLLMQARAIYEAFGWTKKAQGVDGKALRKEWEPKILDPEEPKSLGEVASGIGGQTSTKGKAKKPARNSTLAKWASALRNLSQIGKGWDKFKEDDRAIAEGTLVDQFVKLPTTALDALAKAVKGAKKLQAKEAEAEVAD